jgi:5-formaminoimidazole-4-carboxamide-1-beta-D-ribofuranosyl 5'-monophosphate synthetase
MPKIRQLVDIKIITAKDMPNNQINRYINGSTKNTTGGD